MAGDPPVNARGPGRRGEAPCNRLAVDAAEHLGGAVRAQPLKMRGGKYQGVSLTGPGVSSRQGGGTLAGLESDRYRAALVSASHRRLCGLD